MWSRIIVLLLGGLFCLGKLAAGEDLPSLLGKGRDAFKSGNYEEAERVHRLAVVAAEAGGNAAQRAEAIGDLGGVLTAKGRYDEAESLCLRALGLLRGVGALPVSAGRSQQPRLAFQPSGKVFGGRVLFEGIV